MNITIVGTSDVGVAHGVLLAQYNEVIIFDNVKEKVEVINNREFRFTDFDVKNNIDIQKLGLKGTTDNIEAYENAEYILITPHSNLDKEDNKSLETLIADILEINPDAIIIIKSIVEPGFTEKSKEMFNTENIIYSPDFSKEGKAFYDTFYPSKIVIGEDSERAMVIAELLAEGAIKEEIPIIYTDSENAESIRMGLD